MTQVLHSPFVDRIGWVLVHSLWQFALIALAAFAVERAMRRSSSTSRYSALLLLLLATIVTPIATWMVLPRTASIDLPSVVAVLPVAETNPTRSIGAKVDLNGLSPVETTADNVNTPQSEPVAAVGNSPSAWSVAQRWETVERTVRPWLPAIVAFWLVGVALFALRPCLSCLMLRRLRKVGVTAVPESVQATLDRLVGRAQFRRAIGILQSTLVNVPVVVGYIRPVILLPMSLVSGLPQADTSPRASGGVTLAVAALLLLAALGAGVWAAMPEGREAAKAETKSADEENVPDRLDGLKPTPDSVRVVLKIDRDDYLLGESVDVEYEMINDGDQVAPFENGAIYPTLRINDGFRMTAIPIDENEKPIGPPVTAWPLPQDFDGPVSNFKLDPGESRSTLLFITRYLRFSNPGHYLLRIENVHRGTNAVYSAGETTITFKQPTPQQAEDVYRQMKRSPRNAYDDNNMVFLKDAADFSTMHQAVYLPILEQALSNGDLDALESLERREQLDGNEIVVSAISRALDKDDWQSARACFQTIKQCLPFPNWFQDWTHEFDRANRERVIRTWKADFTPVLSRLARRLTTVAAARFDEVISTPSASQREIQGLLSDVGYICNCVGKDEDFADCLKAYAIAINLTKTLPFETHQYFRPRGSAYGFRFAVRRMLEQGSAPPIEPSHVGEAAAFIIALNSRASFRPEGWQQQVMKWLRSDPPYIAEMILELLPEPIPDEVLDNLTPALEDDYVDLQIAACHVARKHPRSTYQEPLKKILETAKDPYLREYAVDAARANGLDVDYDPDAPFVDQAAEEARKKKKNETSKDDSANVSERVAELIAQLSSEIGEVRGRAAFQLGKLGKEAAPAIPHLMELFGDLLAPVINPEDSSGTQINVVVINALAEIGDASVEPCIEAMLDRIRGGHIRTGCEQVLARIKAPRAIVPLIQVLGDKEQPVRLFAAVALREYGDSAFEKLLPVLSDNDPNVRWGAVTALDGCKNAGVTNLLIERLRDDDPSVRSAAAKGLRNRNSEEAAVTALIAAVNDPDQEARDDVYVALCYAHRPAVVAIFLAGLNDSNNLIRCRCAEGLGGEKAKEGVQRLLAALKSGDEALRSIAARSLGEIGDARALSSLLESTRNDVDSSVRVAAGRAVAELENLSGTDGEIAWGEAIDGVQLGVQCASAAASHRFGEVVRFRRIIRNKSGRDWQFKREVGGMIMPAIDGDSISLHDGLHVDGQLGVRSVTIKAGTTGWLDETEYTLRPDDSKLYDGLSVLRIAPGTYFVSTTVVRAFVGAPKDAGRENPDVWTKPLQSGENEFVVRNDAN